MKDPCKAQSHISSVDKFIVRCPSSASWCSSPTAPAIHAPLTPRNQRHRCMLLDDYGFSWCIHFATCIFISTHPCILRNAYEEEERTHPYTSKSIWVCACARAHACAHTHTHTSTLRPKTHKQSLKDSISNTSPDRFNSKSLSWHIFEIETVISTITTS